MNIKDLRKSYELDQLLESKVSPDPFQQFKIWFDNAIKFKIDEPNAMVLATADSKGVPSARIVLLKGFDKNGFIFFTNYLSRKGKELTENPNAALLFFWKEMERQIRIEGKVKKTSKNDSIEYFNSRPLKSRYGALASNQSEVISDRDFLENKFRELEKKYGDNPPKPNDWGGYRLAPELFEFWQGRRDRMHDRICYKKEKRNWEIFRLSP